MFTPDAFKLAAFGWLLIGAIIATVYFVRHLYLRWKQGVVEEAWLRGRIEEMRSLADCEHETVTLHGTVTACDRCGAVVKVETRKTPGGE